MGQQLQILLVMVIYMTFVSISKFERALKEKFATTSADRVINKALPHMVSTFTRKGLTARLFTFIIALVTAVITTYLIPKKKGAV